MPLALYVLTAGAFGIGVTEFVIMGLFLEVSADLRASIAQTGLLISGYALGVVAGAPTLTVLTRRWPRKTVLIGLMVIFTLGNALGAWVGGVVIERGMGLGVVPIIAALFPVTGMLVAMASLRPQRQGLRQTAQGCPAHEGEA